jgi:hypothetical protein
METDLSPAHAALAQFGNSSRISIGGRHPERSRVSGGAKDLARSGREVFHARFLAPLDEAWGFGNDAWPIAKFKLTHYCRRAVFLTPLFLAYILDFCP